MTFLSTTTEWHAFTIGIYDGLARLRPYPNSLPDNPDVRAEPHYFKGGFVLATLLQVAVLLVVIWL